MTGVDWDCVVIGAGLGGLSAAAKLSRAGLSVLVVEAHDRAGGYASVFERGRYRFEVSLHLMDAVAENQPNYRLLNELGVAESLSFLVPERLRREVWPGFEFRPCVGMAAYSDEIAERLAIRDTGLMRLAELAALAHEDYVLTSVGDARHLQPGAAFDRRLPALRRASAGDVIRRYVEDRRVRAHLDQFASGWLGAGTERLSALRFLIPWYSYHHFGGGYPLGGSAALTRALSDVVTRGGGRILLQSPARKIAISRGRVLGVELLDTTFIRTDTVVSNANPITTFGELVDREHVPSEFLHRIHARRSSVSAIKLWLGLCRPPTEPSDYDVYLCAAGGVGDRTGFDAPLSLVIPGNLDARLVPEAAGIAAITVLVESEWYTNRHEAGFKELIIKELLGKVELTLMPGLSDNLQVLECATPSTFQRFTQNPGGAIYGFWPGAGERPMKHATPVDGLYLASAWTSPGGGFSATMMAGRHVALQILHRRRITGA